MRSTQKLYRYVDEAGHIGEFFLVSVVVLDEKREELKQLAGFGEKDWQWSEEIDEGHKETKKSLHCAN